MPSVRCRIGRPGRGNKGLSRPGYVPAESAILAAPAKRGAALIILPGCAGSPWRVFCCRVGRASGCYTLRDELFGIEKARPMTKPAPKPGKSPYSLQQFVPTETVR